MAWQKPALPHEDYLPLAAYACGGYKQCIIPLAILLEASARGMGHLAISEIRLADGIESPPPHLIVILDDMAMLPKMAACWLSIREYFSEALADTSHRLDNQAVKKGLDELLPYYELSPQFNNSAQRMAVAAMVDAKVGVLTGGPGTGKTTTAAALLALTHRLHPDLCAEDIAICAPTGKAANRLRQSFLRAVIQLKDKLQPAEIALIENCRPATMHRILQWNGHAPEDGGPFHYGAEHKMPYRFVLVDEVSMVDVNLMSHFLTALDPDASLFLLGDADQLDSVEAGGVLAELVLRGSARPAEADANRILSRCSEATREHLSEGLPAFAGKEPLPGLSWGLKNNWRAKDAPWIVELAEVVRPGSKSSLADFQGCCDRWHGKTYTDDKDPTNPQPCLKTYDKAGDFYDYCRQAWLSLLKSTEPWSISQAPSAQALDEILNRFQLICVLNQQVDRANRMAAAMVGPGELYHGFPIMIERNRPDLGLVNGDLGVALAEGPGKPALAIAFPGLEKLLPISHLPKYRLAFALTIHKSQGSEWQQIAIDIPKEGYDLLEPRLLYTAITRAAKGLILHAPSQGLSAMLEHS